MEKLKKIIAVRLSEEEVEYLDSIIERLRPNANYNRSFFMRKMLRAIRKGQDIHCLHCDQDKRIAV